MCDDEFDPEMPPLIGNDVESEEEVNVNYEDGSEAQAEAEVKTNSDDEEDATEDAPENNIETKDVTITTENPLHVFKLSEGDKCVTAIVYNDLSPKIVIYNDSESRVVSKYPSITNGHFCSAAMLAALAKTLEANNKQDGDEDDVDECGDEDDVEDEDEVSVWKRLKSFFNWLYSTSNNDHAIVTAN